MTRPDPFSLVFEPLLDEFPAVRRDAERVGRDPRDRAGFAHVPAVQRLLDRLRDPDAAAPDPAVVAEYLSLLYVVFRFWDAGRTVLAPDRKTLEATLARPEAPVPAPPGGACYLQLPERWVWARVADHAPHEPVDGVFLASAPRSDELTVLAVLGLRLARGGFSQIAVVAHPDDVRAAPDLARPDRFAPVMDGGATAGFRSIVSGAELLLFASLAFAGTQD